MNSSPKWTAKDVITTVLFSVLLIVVQFALNAASMVTMFTSAVLSFAIVALVCAPIYFLMVSKVNKHFVSFVYLMMLGSLYFVMGHWSTILWFVFIGILCEIILWKADSCQNFKKVAAAWVTQSVLYIGVNVLSVVAFWDDYMLTAQSQGMSSEYVNAYSSYYRDPFWLVIIVLSTGVCAFLGSLLGKRILKKHFVKAGVL